MRTDTTSTSGNANENNLVDELVKTGKFTEAEAREFVNNNMQSGTGTDTTSDTTSTSNADTNTADTTSTSNADTNTADTTSTSNADTNTADTTSTSNADTNTDNILRPMTLPHPTTKTTIINLQIITAIILKTMTTLTSWSKT